MLSLSHLPLSPGVYIFKDISGHTLYVGKANRLRQRVRSYFNPPAKLGPKTAQLVSHIASVDYIEVGSEIEALLLESNLIKKFRPHYNIASKDGTSPYYIHISREKHPKPVINHLPQSAIAGPFLSGFIARKILRSLRRVAPYHTESPCFYRHLGFCNPCPDEPRTKSSDYNKNITRLKKLLRGQFKQVLRQAVKSQDFETAAALRDLLQQPTPPEEFVTNPNLLSDRRQEAIIALQNALLQYHPLNPPLKLRGGNPKGEGDIFFHRIECFDIANLSGTSATAAMTVAINGEISNSAYRHFTIHTPGPNDVAMLAEALSRRLRRTDWPIPDLIVLDGGKSQLSIVNWAIPTVALAKQEEIIYTPTSQIKLPRTHPGLQLLQRLRDEAHRFSRRLHHKHRSLIIK